MAVGHAQPPRQLIAQLERSPHVGTRSPIIPLSAVAATKTKGEHRLPQNGNNPFASCYAAPGALDAEGVAARSRPRFLGGTRAAGTANNNQHTRLLRFSRALNGRGRGCLGTAASLRKEDRNLNGPLSVFFPAWRVPAADRNHQQQ